MMPLETKAHQDLEKALRTLEEILAEEKTEMIRDATIQRFEYTFERSWKLVERILKTHGMPIYSPRNAFREAAKEGLVEDPRKWFSYLELRNETIHMYKESMAEAAYEKIRDFPPLVKDLLERIKKEIEG